MRVNTRSKTLHIVLGGLLAAMVIVIGQYGPKLLLPPFSATLGLHAPIVVAMFINPYVAGGVALCSTFGFLSISPVIAARAATHVVFAVTGAFMLKGFRDKDLKNARLTDWLKLIGVFAVTAVIHALCEALVVLPFLGAGLTFRETMEKSFLLVGVGTLIHYAMDFVIGAIVWFSLRTALAGRLQRI